MGIGDDVTLGNECITLGCMRSIMSSRTWPLEYPHVSTPVTEHQPRTYEVRTFGCQMNVHDSERISGLLEEAGYIAAPTDVEPDLVVFNTCAVRENADKRLYGTLGALKKTKENHPGMQIAVGGCLAQKDKDTVLEHAPWVDAVFLSLIHI